MPNPAPDPSPIMLQNYVKKILSSRVYDVAVETPLQLAPNLSRRLGQRVLLKREDLQRVAKQYLTDSGRHVLRYPVVPKKREAKEGEKAR